MMTSPKPSRLTPYTLMASGAAVLLALAAGCSSGGTDAPPPQPNGPFHGSWLGSYRTDQQPSTVFQADLTQNGNQVTGTVTTGSGGIQSGSWFGSITSASSTITLEEAKTETGTSSVTKAVATSNVTITQTKPGCPGTYTGTATVDGTTLTLSFSGSDCNGPQTNGQAVLARQGAVPGSPAPSADVTGTWSGNYTDSADRGAIPLSFTLSQTGGTVTGTYAVGSAVNTAGERGTKAVFGLNNGTMAGTISANIFNFAATQSKPCQGTVSGTATVTGGAMALTFKGLDCNNQQQGGEGTITRQGPPPPGSNNNLAALTVTPININFDSNLTNYAVTVNSDVSSVGLSAGKSDPNAVMTGAVVAGAGQASGQATVALGIPGTTTPISITVTAPNGLAKTYTVSVTRTALAGDNNLSALSVSPGSLSPGFDPGTLNYTVNVGSGAGSVTVSATKSDPNAVMTGTLTAGAGQGSAQSTIQLNGPGTSTPVNITVTAPNGTSKPYSVTISRDAVGCTPDRPTVTVTPNIGFDGTSSGFIAIASSSTSEVLVTASPPSPATMTIGGEPTTSRTVQLNEPGQTTSVPLVVTCPGGQSQTYTLNINRKAIVESNLSALSLSAGSLEPTFSSTTTNYTMSVPFTTSQTTVTASVATSGHTLTINGSAAASGQAFGPLNLNVGTTNIPVVVTAQDGTTKTYTVAITRTAPSTNANLAGLSVKPPTGFNLFCGILASTPYTLVPSFSTDTRNYTVSVPNVTSVCVEVAPADPTATVRINGQLATVRRITLAVPPDEGIPSTTVVTISVTSQDQMTTNIYTLSINRCCILL